MSQLRRLATAVGLALMAGCGADTKLSVCTNAAGNFRVLAAANPTESRQSLLSSAGEFSLNTLESLDGRSIRRVVAYADLPGAIAQATTPEELLDSGIRAMSGKGQWTVQTQGPTALDGHPGREVRFTINAPSASEKGTGRARIFLVGARLYEAIIVGPASRVTEAELEQFVKSFELIQKVPSLADAVPQAPGSQAAQPKPGLLAQMTPPPARSTPAAQPSQDTPPARAAPRVAFDRPVADDEDNGTPPAATAQGTSPQPRVVQPTPSRSPRPAPSPSARPGRTRNQAEDRVVQVGDVGPDTSKPAEIAIQSNRTPHRLIERPEPRGNERERFREAAPDRGLLVGFRVGYVEIFAGPKVAMVQAIFQKGNTYIEGQPFGKEIPTEMTLVARPGYAVGTINTRTGLTVDAFQVVFVRVKDGHFDAKDFYTSDWLGDPRGGGPTTATGQGKLIVGIHGHTNGRAINSLGVLVAD